MKADSKGRRGAALRSFCAFLMIVSFVLAASGCRKGADPGGEFAIKESIAPLPVHAGTETISFELARADGKPETGAHVQLEGDMTHPGMAPVFADATEVAPGSYSAQMNFTMGGDWVVLFHIVLRDGRKLERQMDVRGVASN